MSKIPFLAEITATTPQWDIRYKIRAVCGNKTFNADGVIKWYGKTREEARETLAYAMKKRFYPGVGQLLDRELELT